MDQILSWLCDKPIWSIWPICKCIYYDTPVCILISYSESYSALPHTMFNHSIASYNSKPKPFLLSSASYHEMIHVNFSSYIQKPYPCLILY